MNNRPKAVLFDLDGTLLDTSRDLGAALNHVLRHHGFAEKSYEEYRVESSNGALGLLRMGMGAKLSDFDAETLRLQFLDFYQTNICQFTRPFPGVEQLIAGIETLGLPWGIITNKPHVLTTALLPHFEIFKGCQLCFSGDSFAHRKPHPEPLNRAAELLNIAAEHIWYVGDAQRDMEAAQAANMVSVLAKYGYLTEAELRKNWQVDLVVDSAVELMNELNASISR